MENDNMREYYCPIHCWEEDDRFDSVIKIWLPVYYTMPQLYDILSDIELKAKLFAKEHLNDEYYGLYEAFEDAMDTTPYKWEYVNTIRKIIVRG